jgi:hypothetical protein
LVRCAELLSLLALRLIHRTLDYIFVLDGEGSNDDDRPVVTQLLKPHTEEIMEPGLPMKGTPYSASCSNDFSLILRFHRHLR